MSELFLVPNIVPCQPRVTQTELVGFLSVQNLKPETLLGRPCLVVDSGHVRQPVGLSVGQDPSELESQGFRRGLPPVMDSIP